MLVSVSWLRRLVPLEEEPEAIARALTARGLTVDDASSLGDDTILDVDVPANRPDCLGHLGIARELAAAFRTLLLPRPPIPDTAGEPADAVVTVRIDAPDLCRRYTAALVRNVTVGSSPEWVRRRLEACGLRPINNVVDATNLVLLETGHPIHAFDADRVEGRTIVVRRAAAAERLTTLDGEDRALDPDTLVIADAKRPVAIAGVMGGADSEIVATTRNVLVEAAWFLPRSVRRTSRRLGLATEASQRFERGADPAAVLDAQATALRLLAEIGGGRPAPGIIDVGPPAQAPRRLLVRLQRAAALLGYAVDAAEAEAALGALGLAPEPSGPGTISVTVPSYRQDLEREADLVEEIGRHLGYDRIPSRPPTAVAAPQTGDDETAERARDSLARLGFLEAFNYAMIADGEDDAFVPEGCPSGLPLSNPLADSLRALRRTLLPGLVRAVDLNLRRGVEDVRLFEVGRVFFRRAPGGFPDEPTRAAFAWAGSARPGHWSEPRRGVDLYDAKGIIETLLREFASDLDWTAEPAGLPALHPGRSVAFMGAGDSLLACCGEIHPDLARRLDLPAVIVLGEVDLSALAAPNRGRVRYRAIPRLPSVRRDLSIVLSTGRSARQVLEALRGVVPPAPADFEIVDRYVGPPLADDEVSLTVRVILQPRERTLTDGLTEDYRAALVASIDRLDGARLRDDARSD